MINLGLVGLGYWGSNLLRNFAQLDGCKVKYCCDLKEDNLKHAKTLCPEVGLTDNFESLLKDPEIHALVIAAPAAIHYKLAKQAILHDKHVFVEKPLTLDIASAEELVQLSDGTALNSWLATSWNTTPPLTS